MTLEEHSVLEPPETRYVDVGDALVAYQILGDGPFDLVYFWGLGSHIDLRWDYPPNAHLSTRLASFSRLIQFDRRGSGASDAVDPNATWEEWTTDLGAVLDAAGSESAAIFAEIDAAPIAMLFAALHPRRVSALVLSNASARYMAADDYPIGASPEEVETLCELIEKTWGTPDFSRLVDTPMGDDADFVRSSARQLRAAATPRTAAARYRYMLMQFDAREALPLIQAPTLVIHNTHNPFVPVEHGRYLASRIPGAKYLEMPHTSVVTSADAYDEVIDEIAEFLTGQRPDTDADRALMTVLFTDIVGSTEQAASLRDHGWRTILDRHDRVVREQLRRFSGREIKTTGDGFLASFDGPARAIRCATSIADSTASFGVDVRAGVHTGEVELRGKDIGGIAVHIGQRVSALAGPGEVLVSSTVKDLVTGSGISFEDRGSHALKGLPDEWRIFAVQR